MMQVSLPSEYRRPSLALGLTPVLADTLRVKEGGLLRHIFFDIGHDQLIAFLEPHDVPDVPAEFDAGINRGLGVPAGILLSRPVRRLPWPISATSCAPRA